jgi:hypothetical protein
LLGIELTHDRESRTIALSQRSYIDSILRDFKMTDCNAVMMPMEKGAVFMHDQCPRTEGEREEMRSRPYVKAIGKIMYPCLVSFPQLSFAVRTLSQFMQTPRKVHWEGIKRVLRYLKGARDLQLVLGGVDEGLEGFSDSDFASQPDRHSISGYTFLYGGGAISWSSKCQPIVSLSSTEAEYVALTHAAKEAIWLRALVSEVLHPLPDPTPIFCDNNGVKALAKDDTFHARTKQIDIRYHFIRERVHSRAITIIRTPTKEMVADIFTKALDRMLEFHQAPHTIITCIRRKSSYALFVVCADLSSSITIASTQLIHK